MKPLTTATSALRRALPSRPPTVPFSTTAACPEASSRRHTKALRLAPHPSMLLSPSSPPTTHIIRNPPSAAPTPLITPQLFLPKDDPRRAAPLENESTNTTQKSPLPPALSEPYEKSYHLRPKDFERIRNLRKADPKRWSRLALAREFNTSSIFIGMVCQASEERLKEMDKQRAKAMEAWGDRRRIARDERKRRRAGWGGADGM